MNNSVMPFLNRDKSFNLFLKISFENRHAYITFGLLSQMQLLIKLEKKLIKGIGKRVNCYG